MTDAQPLAIRFDTRKMIGCSARATNDSKFFQTVVEIGLFVFIMRGPALGQTKSPKFSLKSQMKKKAKFFQL